MKLAIVHAALFTKMLNGWGVPIVIEGQPGIAKSAIWKSYAKKCSFPTKVLDSSVGEGAYGVIPVPLTGKDGRTFVRYPAPDWTEPMGNDVGGLVFADEITSNPPLIQSAQMALILDRQIGSYTLPERVRVVGACNPVSVASNGYDIAPPLANRICWIDWEPPSVEEHSTYMLGRANDEHEAKIDAAAEEARVSKAWPLAYATAVGLETAFLRAQPDFKNRCPKPGDPKASRAWPSDRSWEMATRCYASSIIHKLSDDDRDAFVKGCIGTEAYTQFGTFCEKNDLPPIDEVLDKKISWKHAKSRLDMTYAVLNAAVALLTSESCPHRDSRGEVFWGILDSVGLDHLDIIVPSVEAMIRANLHTPKYALPVLGKVQPAVSAAKAALGGQWGRR